jgi:uncharacterized membrane protein YidH (DUF202 family)
MTRNVLLILAILSHVITGKIDLCSGETRALRFFYGHAAARRSFLALERAAVGLLSKGNP